MQAKSDYSAPLVEVLRGPIVESLHRGHLAAVDCEGKVLARLGQPETIIFLRSPAKPLQALPLIVSGAFERFGFTDKELAVACGSHDGTAEQTETVSTMLNKIGLDESFLKCGPHEPYSSEAATELRQNKQKPTLIHNNSSGKHAANVLSRVAAIVWSTLICQHRYFAALRSGPGLFALTRSCFYLVSF